MLLQTISYKKDTTNMRNTMKLFCFCWYKKCFRTSFLLAAFILMTWQKTIKSIFSSFRCSMKFKSYRMMMVCLLYVLFLSSFKLIMRKHIITQLWLKCWVDTVLLFSMWNLIILQTIHIGWWSASLIYPCLCFFSLFFYCFGH